MNHQTNRQGARLRVRSALLATLAAALMAAGCGGGGPPALSAPALGFNDDWASYGPGPDLSRDPFALARNIGAAVVRFPLAWSTVGAAGSRLTGSCRERPGNWAPYDTLYRRLTGSRACTNDPPAADAIAPLPIVVRPPPRYERRCSSAALTGVVAAGAAANRAWGRFVENVADRYPLVKGIEVWNEPNLATFWGKCPLDPERYAKLLEFAHDGIERSAHPDTPTVLAGLSAGVDSGPSSWRAYLGRVFSAPGLGAPVRSLFDVMSVHAYRSPEDVANHLGFAAAAGRNVELARAFLAAHGAGEKPVWVTEVGVTDGGPADDSRHVATAHEQANKLREIYEALRNLDVPVIIIHRFVDSSHKVEPPGYGVVTADHRQKPAYSCLAELNGRPGSCP